MEGTSITQEQWENAKKGDKIIDRWGNDWEVVSNLGARSGWHALLLLPPDGREDRFMRTNAFDNNIWYIVDDEWGALVELNHSDVQFIAA